jgi:hypothetical protein
MNDKKHLNDFVKSLFEDDYAKAKDDLQEAVMEKLKGRMQQEMTVQSQQSNKNVK